MPDAKVKVLVLWSPIRQFDNKSTAIQASAYLADPRVEHFWDLWSYGLKAYTSQLNYPAGQTAWDIWLLYKNRLKWQGTPPPPTSWLQARSVPLGIKYSQKVLAEELDKLVK